MTIERMSIVWEERGASEAMQEGVGSLIVAAVAYVVMGIAWLEHLVFVFPELLLLVIAATLLVGRYTGYRLLELRRFKALRPAANRSRADGERDLMFGRYRALLGEGVLGLNKRNGDYILRFNPRRLYPLVDDKLKTKRLALQAGIAVPQLYGVIETQHDIRALPDIVRDHHGVRAQAGARQRRRRHRRHCRSQRRALSHDQRRHCSTRTSSRITCRTRSTASSASAACRTS